jgi:hypothetical protein
MSRSRARAIEAVSTVTIISSSAGAGAIRGDRANGLTQRNSLAVDPGGERLIADNLKKAGWSWGCVSAVDSRGRTIWFADAHREGKRFVVHADEKLTAFLKLESATRKNSIDTLFRHLPELRSR